MSKHYISPKAICPYYRHEDPQMIYCEGVVEGAVTHEAFADKTNALRYKTQYCRDAFKKCVLYRMLKEIYEDEE